MSERLYPLGFGRLASVPVDGGGVRISITSELERFTVNTFQIDGFTMEGGKRTRFQVSKALDERRWPIDAVLVDRLTITLKYADESTRKKTFDIDASGNLILVEKPAKSAEKPKAIRTAPASMTGAAN